MNPYLQLSYGTFFLIFLIAVTNMTRHRVFSDKYGIFWFVLLLSGVLFNGPFRWASLGSTVLDLVLLGFVCLFINSGILFCVFLTRYSAERRHSIQELAILRFELQQVMNRDRETLQKSEIL